MFELTQIKQDKFLSDLVMALIFDVIHDKILSDRTRRGMIIFDEYAETAQMKSRGEISAYIPQSPSATRRYARRTVR